MTLQPGTQHLLSPLATDPAVLPEEIPPLDDSLLLEPVLQLALTLDSLWASQSGWVAVVGETVSPEDTGRVLAPSAFIYDFFGNKVFYRYQFGSVAQSCLTLCDPLDCSTPGLPAHHQLPELAQTHAH